MGKRSNAPRKPKGQYYTPKEAFLPLLQHLAHPRLKFIEPCAGDGRLCDWMEEAGHSCLGAWDVAPYAGATAASSYTPMSTSRIVLVGDARKLEITEIKPGTTHAITNPPWPLPGMNGEPTMSIIRRMLLLNLTVWALLPADFMHNHYAAKLLRDHGNKIVSIGRVQWFPGTEFTAMDNCCWYQFVPWQKAGEGGPEFIPKARFAHGKR